MNRSNPKLLDFMQYHIDNCPTERGETYKLAKELGQQLIENCKDVLDVSCLQGRGRPHWPPHDY